MKTSDLSELVGLAALWGASFLFMRLGAAEFGPVALSAVRVAGAALVLLPLLRWRGQVGELRRHWRSIFVVGITNSALPFLCFSYAALSITAGLSSIFNASTPLFGAVLGWLWLKDRPSGPRIAGLAIGFAGVLGLAWEKASFKPGGSGWAIVACLAAALMYGLSANYTKRRLQGVAPLAVAAGSQLSAALVLALPALWWWPAAMPSAHAWAMVALLAVLCTGVAYLIYFRLIAHIGPANAITVTFLIPAFAVLWGWLFLAEPLTAAMAVGCAVILLGTALATGVLKPPRFASLKR
ncbi:DMT family transporter [Rhizobacter sp. AJA081-3]|uniref:DMT family transporter n=1 Tax=Rhizobacter sp. AJA081-3 TaxID=2753607 RepID=UPI001AE0A6F9|nr:DMT family transporter [Rhizobacter sp. AJA081-3]QTN24603.1 DMT family transporter [Rhizobacter sp. AJA081-3]